MSNPNVIPSVPTTPSSAPTSNAAVREAFESVSGQIEQAIESPNTHTENSSSGTSSGVSTKVESSRGTRASGQKPVTITMPETEEELRHVLRTKIVAITKELDQSIDQLKKQKKVNPKQLHEYIQRRRSFSQTLRDLATLALDTLKDLYHQFFPNRS